MLYSGIEISLPNIVVPSGTNATMTTRTTTIGSSAAGAGAATTTTAAVANADADASAKPVPMPEPLKPRSLLVRAKLVHSEMKVLQRNINFGKVSPYRHTSPTLTAFNRSVLVSTPANPHVFGVCFKILQVITGQEVTRSLTVVNLSGLPLLYGVSKSGSIASGFLEILNLEGRHGVVEPYGQKVLEFAFRPALPGPLEEALKVYNVCDPTGNTETVTIKSKVMKPPTFKLLTSNVMPAVDDSFGQNVMALVSGGVGHSGAASIGNVAAGAVVYSPLTTAYLGVCELGDSSTLALTFRLRNVSLTPRKFIVDASHTNAIGLLVAGEVLYNPHCPLSCPLSIALNNPCLTPEQNTLGFSPSRAARTIQRSVCLPARLY